MEVGENTNLLQGSDTGHTETEVRGQRCEVGEGGRAPGRAVAGGVVKEEALGVGLEGGQVVRGGLFEVGVVSEKCEVDCDGDDLIAIRC